MAASFPVTYHIFFIILSITLFLLIIGLYFIKTNFDRAIAGIILSFLNILISYIAGQGFFALGFYGYDANGILVNNRVIEYQMLGFIFFILAYISIIFIIYGIWLLYKKPYEKTAKVESNPYIYYK